MRTMGYFPCKVCKSQDDEVILPDPDVDPETGEILSIECKKFEEVHEDLLKPMGIKSADKFANCEATIYENKQILCFKCADGYYYDGVGQVCRSQKKAPGLSGCSLSYDNAHCIFCSSDLQMDVSNGSCVSKDKEIDYNTLDENMSPGAGKGGELSANSNTVARENNVFISGNTWNDEGGATGFEEGDYGGNYTYL